MAGFDIEIDRATKEYLSGAALWDVSLAVERGEAVGLLGSNGAGKTTLIHIVMGFVSATAGAARVLGVPSSRLDAVTRERIGFVAEESRLPPWATLRDLAGLYAGLYRRWDASMLNRFVEEWEIAPDQRVRNLSRGQRRLAELALCFSCRPELLLLDEPFGGLDAVMRHKIIRLMREINGNEGRTLFYSSHILSDVEKVSRRIIIVREGEIALDERLDRLDGSVEEVFERHYGLDSD